MGKPARIGKPQKSGKNKKMKPVEGYNIKRDRNHGRVKHKNQRPVNDDQEVSRSMKRVIGRDDEIQQLNEMKKLMRKRRRQKKKGFIIPHQDDNLEIGREDITGSTVPLEADVALRQKSGESVTHFKRRVNTQIHTALQKHKLEEKYHMKSGGNSEIAPENKRSKKNTVRLKERKKKQHDAKIERATEEMDLGFQRFQDPVEFGEVVLQPPSLKGPTTKAKASEKAGKRALILKHMFEENPAPYTQKPIPVRKPGESVKDKNLSHSKKRMLDKERARVVLLYRQMKVKINRTKM